MDQNQRTKILAGTLAGILGFMFVRPHEVFLKPINEARRSLISAENSLEKAKEKDFELLNAQERISRASDTSLPPETADAQRVYQRWITNLAEQCRFAVPRVAPGNTEFRRGKFLTVDVNVEAETDLEGLSRFLFLFEHADLMHRISSLEIESSGSTGTPRMEVKLTAQGLSILGSPDHSDVFPLTSLPSALAADSTSLKLSETKGFPSTAPFVVQVGREMVRVVEVSEDSGWTLQRGQLGTEALAHPENEYVQLFPVAFTRRDAEFDDYISLVRSSPFVKPVQPRKFSPKLASIGERTIAPGDSVSIEIQVDDLDPDVGAVTFALENAPEDMSIDAATGRVQWTAAPDLEAGKYPATVIVTQKNNDSLRLEKSFSVNVQLPNDAPSISVPEETLVVIGREYRAQITAQDDGPADQLRYSVDGEVPAGLMIEAATGVLSWTPDRKLSPGEYRVTALVTDGGSPAQTDSQEIVFQVQDDFAALTRFTGSVTLDGQQLAFFRNLAQNRNPQLKVGDHIVAAEIDAEITEVGQRHVLLTDPQGVWRLNLGDSLRQRELIKPAATVDPKPAIEEAQVPTAGVPEVEVPEAEIPDTAAAGDASAGPLATESAATDPAQDSLLQP